MKTIICIFSLMICSFTFAQTQYKMCRLKIEKVTKSYSKSKNYRLGKKTSARHGRSSRSESESSFLTMMQGRSSSMMVDDTTIYLKCRVTGSSQYEVDITLNSKESGISTSVYLAPGQRVDLGSVTRDLKDKSRSLDINKGASYSKGTGKKVIEYYLMTN